MANFIKKAKLQNKIHFLIQSDLVYIVGNYEDDSISDLRIEDVVKEIAPEISILASERKYPIKCKFSMTLSWKDAERFYNRQFREAIDQMESVWYGNTKYPAVLKKIIDDWTDKIEKYKNSNDDWHFPMIRNYDVYVVYENIKYYMLPRNIEAHGPLFDEFLEEEIAELKKLVPENYILVKMGMVD